MSREDHVVCEKIKAAMAFVIRRVAKEDTPGRPRGELVGHGGGSVRVTNVDAHTMEQSRSGCGVDSQPEPSLTEDGSIEM
jgi:hypothetical protein